MKKNYKFSSDYLEMLYEVVEEMNDSFKYEGSKDKAVVISTEKGYRIIILRNVKGDK